MSATGRLMKKELFELTPGEQLVDFYRKNPDIAAEELFGFKLMWFQRIALREMWFKPFCCLNMSRGVSKSWMFCLFACLSAMLYPECQIGIIAQTYRQVNKYMFPEIKKWQKQCPYFAACVDGKISIGTNGCIAYFKNGSFVEGLPTGDGSTIRGRRYHKLLVDEYAQVDEKVVKEVLRPMLNIEVQGRDNQYHIASTPYYKWNHYWGQYLHVVKMCILEPQNYGLIEFDWRDINETPVSKSMPKLPFVASEAILEMQRNDMTEEQFAMENLARFPEESSSFFSSKLVDFASPRKHPGPINIRLHGTKTGVYGIGIDVARVSDNFCISVIQEIEGRRKLINVKTLNRATYQEMHSLVRQTLIDFPACIIGIGAGGGGLTMRDLLADPWIDPKTDKIHPRILDTGEETHKYLDGIRIVHMVQESNPLNDTMYTCLKSDMEHGRFMMPSPRYLSGVVDLSPPEEEVLKEIIKTQNEMLKIQCLETPHGRKFDVPNKKRDTKDRVTACVIANYLLSQAGRTSIEEDNSFIGCWA